MVIAQISAMHVRRERSLAYNRADTGILLVRAIDDLVGNDGRPVLFRETAIPEAS